MEASRPRKVDNFLFEASFLGAGVDVFLHLQLGGVYQSLRVMALGVKVGYSAYSVPFLHVYSTRIRDSESRNWQSD